MKLELFQENSMMLQNHSLPKVQTLKLALLTIPKFIHKKCPTYVYMLVQRLTQTLYSGRNTKKAQNKC